MIVLVALYDVHSIPIRMLHAKYKADGHEVRSIFLNNLYTERYTSNLQKLVDTIVEFEPETVGFSIRSSFFPMYKTVVEMLRKVSNATIMVGGCHPTICPEDCEPYADVVHEGEVEGLTFNTENLPAPLYNGEQVYIDSEWDYNSRRMSVITGTGCLFNCSFCYNHIKAPPMNRKSVDKTMSEIEQLMSTFSDIEHIVFSDSIFTWDESWLADFCKEFAKNKLTFRCFSHFGFVRNGALKAMKNAGCDMITLGIQSATPEIRKDIYNIHLSTDKIIKGTEKISASGIMGRYDFIKDLPYETEKHKERERELIERFKKPFVVRRHPLIHHPKTNLTKMMLKDGTLSVDDVEGNCSKSYREWSDIDEYAAN